MQNNFGRTSKNWYLTTLKQDQRVEFDNGILKGFGCICGISNNGVAVLGKTYIVKPDEQIGEYSHLPIAEVHLNPID